MYDFNTPTPGQPPASPQAPASVPANGGYTHWSDQRGVNPPVQPRPGIDSGYDPNGNVSSAPPPPKQSDPNPGTKSGESPSASDAAGGMKAPAAWAAWNQPTNYQAPLPPDPYGRPEAKGDGLEAGGVRPGGSFGGAVASPGGVAAPWTGHAVSPPPASAPGALASAVQSGPQSSANSTSSSTYLNTPYGQVQDGPQFQQYDAIMAAPQGQRAALAQQAFNASMYQPYTSDMTVRAQQMQQQALLSALFNPRQLSGNGQVIGPAGIPFYS